VNPAERAAPPSRERAAFDWYVEPRWAVDALFDAHPLAGCVGDPACGMGTIPEVARARGHDVVACDLVDRGYAHLTAKADFLTDPSPFEGCANIICNPPYSYVPGIAEAFVRQAFRLCPVTVAVLVPVRWLASEMRFRLFNHHTPSAIYHFSKRPSMPPGHLIAELGDRAFKRGKTDYCWIVWERGPRGEYRGAATSMWIGPDSGAGR
jgi:hypothetical protein